MIPKGVNPHPLNPVGGDKVYVRDEEGYGFLGFEVVYADKRLSSEFYSGIETLPLRFRNRVKLTGKYCVSPGCSNLLERGNLCQSHRKAGRVTSGDTVKAKTAYGTAGQRA